MSKSAGYIYILQRCSDIDTNNYKIGKAKDIKSRILKEASYRNCVIRYIVYVCDKDRAEREIIDLFKQKYPYKDIDKEHGNEDFTGNISDMIHDAFGITYKYLTSNDVDDNSSDNEQTAFTVNEVDILAKFRYEDNDASLMIINTTDGKYMIDTVSTDRITVALLDAVNAIMCDEIEHRSVDENIVKNIDIGELLKMIQPDVYNSLDLFMHNGFISFTEGFISQLLQPDNIKWWSSITGIPDGNILCDTAVLETCAYGIIEEAMKANSIMMRPYTTWGLYLKNRKSTKQKGNRIGNVTFWSISDKSIGKNKRLVTPHIHWIYR